MSNLIKIASLHIAFILIFIFNGGISTELLAQSDETLDKILPFQKCYDEENIKKSFIINGEKNEAAYEMMSVIIQQNPQGRSYDATLTTLIEYLLQEIPRSLQIDVLETELRGIVIEQSINSSNFQSKKNEMACVTARFLHGAYLKKPSLVASLPKHYDFYNNEPNLAVWEGKENTSLSEQLGDIENKRNDIVLFYNTLTIALVIVVLIFLFIFWLKNRQVLAEEDIDRKIATAVNEENEAVKAMNQKIIFLEKQQAKNQNKLFSNAESKELKYAKEAKELVKKEIAQKMSSFYDELNKRITDIEATMTKKIDVLEKGNLEKQKTQKDLLQNLTTKEQLKKELDVFREELITYFEKRYTTQTYTSIPEHLDNVDVETKYLKTIFSAVPTPDGLFLQSRMATIPTQDAFYQLSVLADNPMEAEFTLVNNTEWLYNAFARKKTHILSACKTRGPRNFRKVLKLDKGIAVKEENNWRIKTKAIIYYE